MKSLCTTTVVVFAQVLVLIMTLSPGAAAQQSNARHFSEVLKEGDYVRLAAPGLAIDNAVVIVATSDSLRVEQSGQEWVLSVRAVQRLDVQRNLGGRWAVGGAIMGLPLGALSEHFLSKVGCTGVCDEAQYGVGALKGAVVLGVLG